MEEAWPKSNTSACILQSSSQIHVLEGVEAAKESSPTRPLINYLGWHKLYTPLLMVLIAISKAHFHLVVPFNYSKPLTLARIRLLQTKLHPKGRATCPGQPRYDHEITLFDGLLPRGWTKSPYPFQHFIEPDISHVQVRAFRQHTILVDTMVWMLLMASRS